MSSRDGTASGDFAADAVIDGRYRVVDRIASGGMGSVYRVEHLELGRVLALKVMLPGLSGNAELIARFKNEASAIARIGHQNIATITDFGRVNDRFYFVMEFVVGQTLRRVLKSEGRFSVERTRKIGVQIARALSAAHQAGIVHRDLKPDNVMLTQEGEGDFVKVLDFGVAKMTLEPSSALTAPGMLIGTPEYMAPEQVLGKAVDARADVYVLGLLLHEMLTGQRTFRAPAPQIFLLQVDGQPPPLPDDVPPELAALVLQMLEKAPEARPATMNEVVARLDASVTHGRNAPTPASSPTVLMRGEVDAITDQVSAVSERAFSAGPTREAPAVQEETLADEDEAPLDVLPRRSALPWVIGGVSICAAAAAAVLFLGSETSVRSGQAEPVLMRGGPHISRAFGSAGSMAADSPASGATAGGSMAGGSAAGGSTAGGSAEAGSTAAGSTAAGSTAADPAPATPEVTERQSPEALSGSSPSGAVRRVKISLQTVPAGAEVYERDVLLGVTPVVLRREADVATALTFRLKNYEPAARKMVLQGDTEVTVELTRKAPPRRPPAAPPPSELKEVNW